MNSKLWKNFDVFIVKFNEFFEIWMFLYFYIEILINLNVIPMHILIHVIMNSAFML